MGSSVVTMFSTSIEVVATFINKVGNTHMYMINIVNNIKRTCGVDQLLLGAHKDKVALVGSTCAPIDTAPVLLVGITFVLSYW